MTTVKGLFSFRYALMPAKEFPYWKTPNGIAEVFKKYSPMKLQMKREALQKLNRKADEDRSGLVTEKVN